MKMEDTERNLDLLFRGALSNATEEVSPAVWEGVSKAIGKPAKTAFPVWLWWAGVSFAAAAAVALGVFLFNHTPQQVPDSSMVANATEPATEEFIAEEEVAPLEEQLSRSAGLSAYVPARTKSHSVAAAPSEISSPSELYAAEEQPVAESEEAAPAAEEPSSESAPAVNQSSESAPAVKSSDPVTFPTETSAKSKTGVSLLAGGNLGGNVGSRSVSPSRMYSQGEGSFTPGMSGLENYKYGPPVSATLGLKWQFHPRWAVGTGVSFTMLPSTCSGTYTSPEGESIYSDKIHHFQTYVGVPLNFYFTIVESKAVGFYTFAGGAVEKSIINRYTFNNGADRIRYKEKVKGVQPSVGLGIGVDFRFTKFLSLYIDPSVRYYFDCKQPQSIRTVQPVALSLDAGLRFGF